MGKTTVSPSNASWHRPAKSSICKLTSGIVLCLLVLSGCGVKVQERKIYTPTQALERLPPPPKGMRYPESEFPSPKKSPYLKAHMKNGGAYVFSKWQLNNSLKTVSGLADYLDINRVAVHLDTITIHCDSVALFETNEIRMSGGAVALGVVTGISAAITILCITNPKSCFGSCPTFYASDGERMILQAEGFSSSVAPALEARDIDALYRAKPRGRDFQLLMKNEALETHRVRYADLIVVPRPRGGRVFTAVDGSYWQGSLPLPPSSCIAPDGDCLALVREFDGLERLSLSDSLDLTAKETLDLDFGEIGEGNWGLVVACRQSLVTTYVFYQILAYLGNEAVPCLAAMSRGNNFLTDNYRNLGKLLGGIEVFVKAPDGDWRPAGKIYETGPLATDVHLLQIPDLGGGNAQIRLRLSKGSWRIDQIGLVKLLGTAEGMRIRPSLVDRNGTVDNDALAALLDLTSMLATIPGDSVTITYRLPENYAELELFLESRGYYLEWIRDEWLAEENPAMAAMVMTDPAGLLRLMAPMYKDVESEMEQSFWSSRYAK